MPTFQYRCPECQTEVERMFMSIETIVMCPWCAGSIRMPRNVPMDRLPAAPNFAVHGFNAKNHYGAKS